MAGEIPDTVVPLISVNAFVELSSWNQTHKLCKGGLPVVTHGASPVGSAHKVTRFKSCTRFYACN